MCQNMTLTVKEVIFQYYETGFSPESDIPKNFPLDILSLDAYCPAWPYLTIYLLEECPNDLKGQDKYRPESNHIWQSNI